MMFFRSSGLYQKKNWRCASFSRWVLALNIGSSVYGWNPLYQASVATVIGVGVKSCTCSRWKSRRLVITASSAMSSSLHPGCEEIKYGISCWRRFSSRLMRSNIFLNVSNCSKEGLRITDNTRSLVCSGATFNRPLTWLTINSRVYSAVLRLIASSLLWWSNRS